MLEFVDTDNNQTAVIKVIGVGGGGGNALEHMLAANIEGVEFICANTDAQALSTSTAKIILQLGRNLTKGLGAGTDPDIGSKAALEDRDRIMEILSGADMVFITAGMGGGTGTGAAPIVAQVSKEMGILTVAVVTRPFTFEGQKRAQIANQGIKSLGEIVDSLIIIPNEKLSSVLGDSFTLLNAFSAANDILLGSVQGIAELITHPGLINVDFADVKTVMSEMGMAMIGSGKAQGEDRANLAAQAAISSPLLEDINLSGARGILVNITADKDMSLGELNNVGDTIKAFASDDATVVIGTAFDRACVNGEMRVTIVATGLGQSETKKAAKTARNFSATNVESIDDYDAFDEPTLIRNQNHKRDENNIQADELDLPAFLQRQAD